MALNRRDFVRSILGLAPIAGIGAYFARQRANYLAYVSSCGKNFIRPPAARPEREFLARCIRCRRCAEACPNSCIKFFDVSHGLSIEGTPYIKPREKACILCMKCTQACPSQALEHVEEESERAIRANVKMGTAKVDKNICYSYNGIVCGTCTRACRLGGKALKALLWERPEVDADVCVGCGLCEQSCIHYPPAIRVIPSPGTTP